MRAHFKIFGLFLVVSVAFRGLYLCLFYDRHSFDVTTWGQVADALLVGENPYRLKLLCWPPFCMQLIFLFKKISLFLNCPFIEVLRIFLIITESVLAGLLYATLVRFTETKDAAKLLILGLALNPIAIFQVCQHCNFDVLAGLWMLLAVHVLLRFQEHHESRFWLLACFALGMGALTKTVPLCLAPLLLLAARKLKLTEQLLGAILLLGPIILGMSVIYVLSPEEVTANVLGYRSTPGYFGFSGLFTIFGAQHLQAIWPRVFEIIYGTVWLSLSAWLWTKETLDKRQIVSLATGLLLAICALGPGYGLQYVYWFLPLLLLQFALADRPARVFLLIFYAVTAVTYTIEYAMNYVAYGAFLLDLTQNETLVRWGDIISSRAGETWLCLPLWLFYCWHTVNCLAGTGREMLRDFQIRWRRA